MTTTVRQLVAELEALPEDQQNEIAASLLEDLRRQIKRREPEREGLYESFRVLKNAKLQLPPDASETSEKELYDREVDDGA